MKLPKRILPVLLAGLLFLETPTVYAVKAPPESAPGGSSQTQVTQEKNLEESLNNQPNKKVLTFDKELPLRGTNITSVKTTSDGLGWIDKQISYSNGNSSKNSTISVIEITIPGPGLLSFDYSVSSCAGRDFLCWRAGEPITSADDLKDIPYNQKKSGVKDKDYTPNSIAVKGQGPQKIYFAYIKDADKNLGGSSDMVRLKNLAYSNEGCKVTVSSKGPGTITGAMDNQSCIIGEYLHLDAKPNKGSIFCGWYNVADGRLMSNTAGYDYKIPASIKLEARFAEQGSNVARIRDKLYPTLNEAVSASAAGDEIVLLSNTTLSESAVLPAEVFLLVPCMEGDGGYDQFTGHSPNGKKTTPNTGYENASLYNTLTIPKGVTFTVNGKILVNAEVGRPAGGHFDQDINGGYGQINLDGKIVVENGGTLESYGRIEGTGEMTVKPGGTVTDLYVVKNWRGGTQASDVYFDNVYPMNEIDCHNIKTPITIESGATYQGAVRMFAGGTFNYTRFPQVDNTNGIIRLKPGAKLVKTFEGGRSKLSINGGAIFDASTLYIVGINMSTAELLYPIDGDIDIELAAGEYEINKSFKGMPGFTCTLKDGANLLLAKNQTFVLYDDVTFVDVDHTSNTEYPAGRGLAKLIMNGGSRFTSYGHFAGNLVSGKYIKGEKYAKVILDYAQNENLTVQSKESAGMAKNARTLTFATRLFNGDKEEKTLTTGDTKTWYFSEGQWSEKLLAKLPGDVNNSGKVNIDDLNMLLQNYNKSGKDIPGDVNNSGKVNIDDLNILLQNYNKSIN